MTRKKVQVSCLQCGVIFMKCPYELKRHPNSYCSKSCLASHTNTKKPKRIKIDFTIKHLTKTKGNRREAFRFIRSRARTAIKNRTSCQICGYDKHVEAAHIKAISSFSDDVKLSTINSPSNLLALCPNCHWEFDHGMVNLDSVNLT